MKITTNKKKSLDLDKNCAAGTQQKRARSLS
jgi:hypothetical protein